jgi:S1-C subfamily serine protease
MAWQKLKTLPWVGGLSILLSVYPTPISMVQSSTQLSIAHLRHQASIITVKILSTEFVGSGILLNYQKSIYTVITNAHVLRGDDPPYHIQTPDGKIHTAELVKNVNFQGNDLAMLTFTTSNQSYAVATLGATPKMGDQVFVAGFPIEEKTEDIKFVFTPGQVFLVLEKPLQEGYQVGYSNRLEKGMSGGALLNNQGQVVGVNGMHAYPLWDSPSVFADGSQAEEKLHQQIVRLSWAIPIDKISWFLIGS